MADLFPAGAAGARAYDDDTTRKKRGSGCKLPQLLVAAGNAARVNGHRLGSWIERISKVGKQTTKVAKNRCLSCGATIECHQHAVLVERHDGWDQDAPEPAGKCRNNVVGEKVVNAICPVPLAHKDIAHDRSRT